VSSETIVVELLRVNLVASAAIALILALRPWVLRRLGARVAWWSWLVVPVAVGAGLLPAREAMVVVRQPIGIEVVALDSASVVETQTVVTSAAAPAAASPWVALPVLADAMVVLWFVGAAALLARSIVNTRRLARDASLGPALVEVARCANWFNPLIHLAARRMRHDQELACDAAVIAARPIAQRAYAQALLKTQVAPAFLPLGCTWTSGSAELLAQRITLLNQPSLSRRSALAGTLLIAFISFVSGYAAWAQQPDRVVTQVAETPQGVWTSAAEAPAGILSHALEGQRHDLFIELARKGDIDFVLFGTTDAEMFWWPARGKSVWEREFGAMKAANFGAQGTSPRSLPWRMRNGELAGYQAKLVILQAGFCMDQGAPNAGGPGATRDTVVASCAPVIAEIRAHQPQAKILILSPFPRGLQNQDEWRRNVKEQNRAAFARLIDEENVFYADFGERFFLPDGTHNQLMWSRSGLGGTGVGIQPPAYEAWAEELRPWLDRFVR
jgi:beta-lactamase regulating signal transducer with metallopeptidase domain